MSQGNVNVTANHLYEEAFNIKYEWEKFLPKEVFKYMISLQKSAMLL